MKRLITFASVLVLLAAPAFAAGNKPQNVVIPQNVQIGTTQVPAGNYKLATTGAGANVQVTLTQSGKTVATFTAKATEQKNANPGVTLRTNSGVANLETIMLNNTTLDLVGSAKAGQ